MHIISHVRCSHFVISLIFFLVGCSFDAKNRPFKLLFSPISWIYDLSVFKSDVTENYIIFIKMKTSKSIREFKLYRWNPI